MNLTNKNELISILSGFDFRFSKSLGQNFLIDKNVLTDIITKSGIDLNTNVLEIGPGAGTLTRELCAAAKKVVAVEIDSALVPVLNYVMSEFDNFTLINSDILKVDMRGLINDNFGGGKFSVVANLPYYITTPIIMNLFENDYNIRTLTLMVQKEVAERITARPGTKNYGALTVGVGFYADSEIICQAPPHCFVPQPSVSSVVIKLSKYENPPYEINDKDVFFKIVKSVFSQRRKTLVNSLSGSPFINCDKNNVIKALEKMNLDTKIRGEKLSINELVDFSNIITSNV